MNELLRRLLAEPQPRSQAVARRVAQIIQPWTPLAAVVSVCGLGALTLVAAVVDAYDIETGHAVPIWIAVALGAVALGLVAAAFRWWLRRRRTPLLELGRSGTVVAAAIGTHRAYRDPRYVDLQLVQGDTVIDAALRVRAGRWLETTGAELPVLYRAGTPWAVYFNDRGFAVPAPVIDRGPLGDAAPRARILRAPRRP